MSEWDWAWSAKKQLASVTSMIDGIARPEIRAALDSMEACSGLLVFTGVGQNMILANKVASTFTSLSLRSISVDPTASLHGAMAILTPQDLVVAISRSGETSELLAFVSASRVSQGSKTIAVHSMPNCQLAEMADLSLFVPSGDEADRMGLAPTSSSVCFLLLLQAMAVDLAQRSGLTAEEFLTTHPAGTLGLR